MSLFFTPGGGEIPLLFVFPFLPLRGHFFTIHFSYLCRICFRFGFHMMGACCSIIVNILLFPIIVVFFVIFLVVWLLLTITGIGPFFQYVYKRRDEKILYGVLTAARSDIQIIDIPGHINSATGGKPYKIAARFTESVDRTSVRESPPVCFPGGLGATLMFTNSWQEELNRRGYQVLSFDRLGVGFSDDNPTGQSPTAADVVREMDYVMSTVLPSHTTWILVGGSMGNIVAQCYTAAFPNKVEGIVNVDGLPYPFTQFKSLFRWAALPYKMYANIIWTGVFRPFIRMGLKSIEGKAASRAFPFDALVAQFNQAKFFSNLAIEMATMMDCCEYAASAWSTQNILKLDKDVLEALVRAEPDENVDIDATTGVRSRTIERSPSERGATWTSRDDLDKAVRKLHALAVTNKYGSHSPSPAMVAAEKSQGSLSFADVSSKHAVGALPPLSLPQKWSTLVTRSMSGRNHDFGNTIINSFYNQDMRDLAAAEHVALTVLSRDGRRIVYPKKTHMEMFLLVKEVADLVDEVAEACDRLN